MICSFNGQDSQRIQPLLPHAAQVGLNQFQFGKESLGCCPVTCIVRNNSRAVHRRLLVKYMYTPNGVCVCVCVYVHGWVVAGCLFLSQPSLCFFSQSSLC